MIVEGRVTGFWTRVRLPSAPLVYNRYIDFPEDQYDNIIRIQKTVTEVFDMMFNMAYQSSYCEYKQSWFEKSEYGSIAMRSEDKRKPGRKHADVLLW